VRHRSRDLIRAVFLEIVSPFSNLPSLKFVNIRQWVSKIFDQTLIVPALIHEELSVKNASQRSPQLMAPIRQKIAYPLFRRVLAFALGLTALQQILVAAAFTLDLRHGNFDFTTPWPWKTFDLMIWLPGMTICCIAALSVGLKSAIEQAVLYLTARKALGEIP